MKKELKWYHPFKLRKINKELNAVVKEQEDLIKAMTREIMNDEKIIESLKEDNKALLEQVEVKPAKAKKTTKKVATKKETKTTKKSATKKATAKKETKTTKKTPAKKTTKK